MRGPLVGQVPRQGNSDAVRLVSTLAAILSIGAGVIHVSAAGDHTSLPVMFAGFLVVATLQIALGALLLWRRPSKLLIAAGLGLMVGSIAVWVLSRTQGLPFLEDGHTEPIGFKDGVTVLFELGSIPLLLLLLSRELDRVSLPSPRLASHALALTGVGCFALMAPALLLGGGEHHSHEQAVELGLHEDDHSEGEELAHAGEPSSHEGENGHPKAGEDSNGRHAHKGSDKPGGGHGHSGVRLAGAPLGAGHEHSGSNAPDDAPNHHGNGNGDGDKQHHRGRHDGDKKHGGNHGGGGHGNGEHGGEDPGGEPPVSVSYEPEPSVCVMGVCVP